MGPCEIVLKNNDHHIYVLLLNKFGKVIFYFLNPISFYNLFLICLHVFRINLCNPIVLAS